MSKAVSKQLSQKIELLEEATQKIEELMGSGRDDAYVGLLMDCQDLAIAVGTYIEQLHGVGTRMVARLEDYCEKLYAVAETLQAGDTKEATETAISGLKESLCSVRAAFTEEFPDKKEVVFMPYKASMWDSLESVWKAADADPECEAYVIPIPYYDKNPDGTFREYHYEGDLYPDYVPIVRYDEYNLAERHPDVIYIHNPYDDGNYVTTVDPEYYSNKLQICTDELVYIPYFVLSENGTTVENVKKFCLTKGVVNADKVIVQSERIRQVYVTALEETLGECDPKGRKWIEKILGLGSPKIEKIKHTRKDEVKMPDFWREKIVKKDGSWKKIIFYNTSLTSLLENNNASIKKMRWVFDFFRKRTDDIVLLWRPHPLIESTLLSMRPQLYQEYEQLKEEYVKADWGIYDNSADVDRAVILCDGYYGDRSSVVLLCQKAGKKVLIQDVIE